MRKRLISACLYQYSSSVFGVCSFWVGCIAFYTLGVEPGANARQVPCL